ncbi:MAG TPA: hypothetical protein VGN32_14515, partial [Ktedonobacterales bacterium]|nr:hypothetical protein [Ktedonobacterales bacterium]
MGLCLGDLDQRDLARLRTELVEVIAARFAYPAYYDFRAGASRVRPTGAVRRQEISTFVQAIILEPIARLDVSAPQIRRFLEQVFLRYLELNPDLAREAVRRRAESMRVAVPQAAAEVQRGLVAFAAGAPGNFGAPRPAISWAGTSSGGARGAPDGEHGARGTALLQAALTGQAQPEAESQPMLAPRAAIHEQRTAQPVAWSVPAAEAASTPWDSAPTHTRAGAASSESLPPWLMEPASNPSTAAPPPAPAVARPSAFNPGTAAWSDPAREETAPLPAHLMQLNRSLFAGLETGSQSD